MSRGVLGSYSSHLLHSGTEAEALRGADSCCAKEYIRSHLCAPHEPFTWTAYFVGKAEACAWIFVSLALGYFGNGEFDTLYVLMHDSRIHQPALMAAVMAGVVNVLLFLYINIWVRHVRGIAQDPELAISWAIPLATVVCVFGWTCALTACWGVWSWGTPILGAIHGMALIMWSTFLPAFGTKDHQE